MNILVLGNGFDLAHGLPTAYPDFLGFCRMIKAVYAVDKNTNADKLWTELKIKLKSEENTKRLKNKFSELYSVGVVSKDDKNRDIIRTNTVFDELYDDIEENFWVEYFIQNPMYQKDNWIDFESEISKKIQQLDEYMKKKDVLSSIRSVPDFSEYFQRIHEEKKKRKNEHEMKKIFEEWFENLDEDLAKDEKLHQDMTKERVKGLAIEECDEFKSFKNMILRLEVDLNKLIRALEIYLEEYVGKMECKVMSPDIKKVTHELHHYQDGTNGAIPSNVLCFNYTNTYKKIYFKDEDCVDKYMDFIHGKTDINNTIETNNMVLGIDEYLLDDRKNKDVELIAFKKFYQRIYKGTGCEYKEWVEQISTEYKEYKERKQEAIEKSRMYVQDDMHRVMYQLEAKEIKNEKCIMHNLYIFGHSLDVTDGDILRDLILNDNVYTTIFYHNRDVMGQQIANLVKVIGQDELIKRTGGSTKTIEFKLQQDMVER